MLRPPTHDFDGRLDSRWHQQDGFTLIELLVAMLIALVVSAAAFAILNFTSRDVTRITARAHVDQTGRVALEKIMLALHSTCVSPEVNPIIEGSNGEKLKFISESGLQASFATVTEHEITYNAAEGALVEKTYLSTGPETGGNYPFSATPASTTKLLTGVKQSENGATPVFQYYRYYKAGDPIPAEATELPLGELKPGALPGTLTKPEAEKVAKTTVSFTVAPEGNEVAFAKGGQPIALEDSAVFRLTPASIATGHLNTPCSEAP